MAPLLCLIAILAAPKLPERRVLLPLDYQKVRITSGMFRRQLDEAKEFYLRIPNDDLLLGFRRRAGLPAPGVELGGWYSDDVFHVFGQILSGLARMYRATGDDACRVKASALLEGWEKCVASDGYFYASNKPNAPHYTYDKMVGGLVDVAAYCGRADALAYLAKITAWAETHLDRKNVYAFNAGSGSTEWYTLSENLYRAYLATGDERYKSFAKVWEYTDYWRLYADKQDLFGIRSDGGRAQAYHAYSHVNNLGGAGMAYRVTGAPWYLATITNAYDYLRANECFATGAFGPNESLVPKARVEQLLDSTHATFETQCGTWAVFKLCKHLITLTGQARFGDWAEQVAYNGIGATIPMTAAGNVFYYSDYNPYGGAKRNHSEGWTCCTGTRPMAIADVSDLIYFRNKDSVYVNLFVPSTAEIPLQGGTLSITQTTSFPEDSSTTLEITSTVNAESPICIREPEWLAGSVVVETSGRKSVVKAYPSGWIQVCRVHKGTQRIKINLPIAFKSVPLDTAKPYPTAIVRGPIAMAFRSPNGSPVAEIDLANLNSQFKPIPGEPLDYHLSSDPAVLVRPFYEFKEGERYFLYLDPKAAGRIPYTDLRRDGPWRDSDMFWFCNVPGSWVEGTFTGDQVEVLGYRYDDAGHASVVVDGKQVGIIDQYGPGRDLPGGWKFTGLGGGRHTIRITILDEKSAQSKDRYVNVAGLRTKN